MYRPVPPSPCDLTAVLSAFVFGNIAVLLSKFDEKEEKRNETLVSLMSFLRSREFNEDIKLIVSPHLMA
jgi:hypothetical protein